MNRIVNYIRVGNGRPRRIAPRHFCLSLSTQYLVLSTLFFLSACAGLGGEPRIVATVPAAVSTSAEVGYPSAPPDLALGAQLYAENCTRCHGVNGQGDGELVMDGQVPQPPDFTDLDTTGDQTPAQWFEVITNGRIERLMPPWRDALTEEQRWAVAMYTYTMPYSQAMLDEGQAAYAAADPAPPQNAFTNQAEMVSRSDQALYTLITEGQGDESPAFAANLTDEQRWAAVAYVRSLSLANTDAIGAVQSPAQTPEATAEIVDGTITVTGQVTNGTAGGAVPVDLPVNLFILSGTDENVESQQFESAIDAEGRYSFTGIPFVAENGYIVSVPYRERVFTSDLITGAELAGSPRLPVTIYELTEDPTVIRITAITMRINGLSDGLQILHEIIFQNTSDRMYTNSLEVGENVYASVVVGIPPGVAGMSFPGNPNRFVMSEEQFVVVDTVPVLPGVDHAVQLSYFLPYEDGAVIEYPVYFNTEAENRLLVYPEILDVTSEQLAPAEQELLNDRVYDVWTGNLTLSPGDVVRFDLSGDVPEPAAPGAQATVGPIVIIVLVVEIALIVGVLFLYMRSRRRRAAAKVEQPVDVLIRQIAELDNRYQAGKLDEADYQQQRAALKTRLAELMEKE